MSIDSKFIAQSQQIMYISYSIRFKFQMITFSIFTTRFENTHSIIDIYQSQQLREKYRSCSYDVSIAQLCYKFN